MRTPRQQRGRVRAIWLGMVLAGAVASCGSRTGLWGEEEEETGTVVGGADAAIDRRVDASVVVDTGRDVVPPIDVQPRPDADRTDCPDADSTYVYLVNDDNQLFSFYPPDLAFKLIGTLVCPGTGSATPFSMAVDRRGVAYVLYTNGTLYRVSTATAACQATTFVADQNGFATFGMGFASDVGGAAERLYVSDNDMDGLLRGLGSIDTTTFKLGFIGPFGAPIRRSELTGTGDGRLFAFWPDTAGGDSHLSELDKATGSVVAQTNLPVGQQDDAFAFAFWGGDFWIFTGGGGSTDVSRFRPSDGTVTVPITHPSTIVGAGVSTCAPQE